MKQMNRRSFFKMSSSALGLALVTMPLANVFAQGRRKKDAAPAAPAAGGSLPMVEVGKGMAANVNYQCDKAKVTTASLKVEKQGVAFDKQFCDNCVLYTEQNKEAGKCTLFPGALVCAKGWCTSWSKKA